MRVSAFIGVCLAALPALVRAEAPQPLVTAPMLADGRVSVEVKTAGAVKRPNRDPAAFFDGQIRGTGVTSNVPLVLGRGASAAIVVRFARPRLLNEIQVLHTQGDAEGFSAAITLLGPPDLDLPASYARHMRINLQMTSCIRWPGLQAEVRGVRLKLTCGPKTAMQVPELRLLGRADPQAAPSDRIELMPAERLAVAARPCEFVARVARRTASSPTYRRLVARLLDHAGKPVRTTSVDLPAATPSTAAEVRWRWRMPAVPDLYTVHVSAVGDANARLEARRKLPATARRLHCVWYGVPTRTRWGTAYCAVSDGAGILTLRERGVLPLAVHMATFKKAKDISPDQRLYWARRRLSYNPVGYAIDEYSSYNYNQAEVEGNALVRIRQEAPDAKLYVWVVGSRPGYMDALGAAADLIMQEVYLNRLGHKFNRFDRRIAPFYARGLAHKTVFGIATDVRETAQGVEKQLRYIRLHFPELPGLAVYKAYGDSAKLVGPTDELFYKYFVAPVIFCQPHPRHPGQVQIKNRGGLTARNVRVELVGAAGGKAVGSARLAEIYPGETHQINWLKLVGGLKPGRYHVRLIVPAGCTVLNAKPVELTHPRPAPAK